MQFLFGTLFVGLQSLHIHDATIEFSDEVLPIIASETCTTIHLSSINFIVSPGLQKYLNSPNQSRHALVGAIGRNSTLTMDNCVVKTACDTPPLLNLVLCAAMEGGQVGLFAIWLQECHPV
jgi:hypothetical protein